MKHIHTVWHADRGHMIFGPVDDADVRQRLRDCPMPALCDFYTVVSLQLNHESEVEFKPEFALVARGFDWLRAFHQWRRTLSPEQQRQHQQGLAAISLRHWSDALELLAAVQDLHGKLGDAARAAVPEPQAVVAGDQHD